MELTITHVLPSRRIRRTGGLDEVIRSPEGYRLAWSLNGKRDSSDTYGVSWHTTLKGARIARTLRKKTLLRLQMENLD